MPRWFFLVTNWSEDARSADELLAHYRKRGTFEDRLDSRRLVVRIAESAEPLWCHLTSRLSSWRAIDAAAPKLTGFTPPPAHSHLREVLRF